MLKEAVSKAFSPGLFLDVKYPWQKRNVSKKEDEKKKKAVSDSVRMEGEQRRSSSAYATLR